VLEAAVRALRRIHLRRRQEEVQRQLRQPAVAADRDRLRELLAALEGISRALRDPALAEQSLAGNGQRNDAEKKKTA